ncbi:cytochrome c oxidase assembly protein [Chitinivorax sp. B]|uniref:cytochrome c oxidase assembly protein n=1 Tax=Chitinivorax sp. B TaxID=2502235 RepID=UPI0010F86250|nr:cytochrome c oxidase assembly protein [Chitinivorax sp. B]
MSALSDNRQLFVKLSIIAAFMFGFGFMLVPLYKKICEATGINNVLKADDTPTNTQVDATREVTIEFDANLRSNLPWRFKPKLVSMKVHPGQLVQVEYELENLSDKVIVGQAIPSYGPAQAGPHFRKLDCFCFTQQTIQPREKRRMPVVFLLDSALPKELNTVTLSYTFFEVEGGKRS